MRLSRLNIAGFKSFPDRAELGFDQGVTAIVGPNGCGKSNVVDAITWVLGEQSAKSLRGERMEDVIFNGSDARKPTAAAEVRLKLTEVAQAAMAAAALVDLDPLLDEHPLVTRDVEIGRRLYRSGESEYLIDGQVCRLRDVHDLLMDSGLGVKAYAVIEQGKIGQILASRPAERRALIEEAAGVTKYKARRHAAELKLKAAEQNLTRIDDIVFEVEKQRMALRRQAARARRYRRLREELRRWEQVEFAHRHESLSRDIDAADVELGGIREREVAAAARVAELENALEGVRLGLTEAEVSATSSRESAHARELEIGRRQQQITFEKQQIEELEQQARQLAEEAADLEGRQGPAREAVVGQREAARTAQDELGTVGSRVEAAEGEYRAAFEAVQAAEAEADGTRAVALGSATTLSALRQARENAAAVRDRVAVERERLDLEQRELEAGIGRVDGVKTSADEALSEARAVLAQSRESRVALDDEVTRLRTERTTLADALAGRRQALAAVEARLQSLEQVEAGRASFGDAARFLLAGEDEGLTTEGALADHVEVERSYERAVDALLGDLLRHVVVRTGDDVKQALGVLGRRQAGRCGFVVLDALARSLAVSAGGVPPPAVALSAVLGTTGPVAGFADRLFPQALIVETFEQARDLSRTAGVPVAALTGEVFRAGWRVEGGDGDDVRGILETRAEIASLRDRVAGDESEVSRLAAELETVDAALPLAESRQSQIVADLHEAEKRIVALESEAGRAADDLVRLTDRLGVVETERRRTEEEERATTLRRDEAGVAIAEHETRQEMAQARLETVLTTLQVAREGAEARLQVVTDARTTRAALVERSSALDAEVVRLEEAAGDLEARLTACRQGIERTEVRRAELRTSIADTEAMLDSDVGRLDGLQGAVRGFDERVVGLREEVSAKDQEVRQARQVLEAVRAELMRSEVNRARAASDLSHLATACVEALSVSLDEVVREVARMEEEGELVAPARRVATAAEPDADEEVDVPEIEGTPVVPEPDEPADMTAEEVIADLKEKIERLGPVNMMAIEQFDELEARHEFLTTQRKDLLDSIEQTGEAIRKIDKTTRERFSEAFAVINTNFQGTFATLFGGGRAGLVLIDQEDDAESGVDIVAQPPGKRLQNVQLLSGGEKALTAMALMFAVFQYRPSPFCLLDEIDAPLDDANIGRFVEMLQGMQGHTQFILVTHNRKTMEIANRLYGVTMEEPGVSKLISLQVN